MVRGIVTEYPPPWSRLWPDSEHGPWRATLHYSIRDGEAVVVGVDLVALDRDTCPPLSENYRRLSVAQLARESGVDRIAAALREIETLNKPEHSEQGGPSAEALRAEGIYRRAGKQRGRPPLYDDAHWQDVARTYSLHVEAGRADPTNQVAERFNVSRSTAKNWVTKTRDRGYLPRAKQGQRPRRSSNEERR